MSLTSNLFILFVFITVVLYYILPHKTQWPVSYTHLDEFDISITPAEIIPENFNSAAALWAMVQRLQNE